LGAGAFFIIAVYDWEVVKVNLGYLDIHLLSYLLWGIVGFLGGGAVRE
jgi:hypothetical protein